MVVDGGGMKESPRQADLDSEDIVANRVRERERES